MRFTWDKDTRMLAAGSAMAIVCGIMLGGAMRPELGDDGRPAGPQQIAGWNGLRSSGPFDPVVSSAAYSYGAGGQVPDYVLGTDWKRAMNPPVERAAVSEPRESDREATAPAVETNTEWVQPVTRAAYADDDPPPPRGRYPSLGGDAGAADDAEADDTAPAGTG